VKYNTWGGSSSPRSSPRNRSKRSDKEENNESPTKSITGIWTVHFSNFAEESQGNKSTFSQHKYQMRIKKTGNSLLSGNCILDSGPNAFEFVINGQIDKHLNIEYNIKAINLEFWVKAKYDGNDIIKSGMWYRDKRCQKKGGVLVAVRKGTELPSSLIPKPMKSSIPIQYKSKSKTGSKSAKSPSRKRKLSNSSSSSPWKKRKVAINMIEDLAKSKKPPSSYTCFTCGAEGKMGMKWKSTHFDNVTLLKCLGCHNVWDKGEGKYQCDGCYAVYCCRCVFRDMAENGDYDEQTESEDESEEEEEEIYKPKSTELSRNLNHNHNHSHSTNGKGISNRGSRNRNTLAMYGFTSQSRSQSVLPALEKDSSPDKDKNEKIPKRNMKVNRTAIVISDDETESDQERTELQEEEEKLEVEDKPTDIETPRGDDSSDDEVSDEDVVQNDNESTDTNDTDEVDEVDQDQDMDSDMDQDSDIDSDNYDYEYSDDDIDIGLRNNTKIKAATNMLNMIEFLLLAWQSGAKPSSFD